MFESKKNDVAELKEFIELAKKLDITDRDKYPSVRVELNVRAISALLGIDFDRLEDGSFKITAVHEVPSSEDVFEIIELVDDFLCEVENTFIPGGSINSFIHIPEGETISNNVFCELVFGNLTNALTLKDFMTIGKLGAELRKYRKRRRNMIIGGIAVGTIILVAGGAFYIYRNK